MDSIPSGRYTHYKDPTKQYEIVAVGYMKATLERVVVYRALYDTPDLGSRPIFVRPLKNFTATVVVGGKPLPRFKKKTPD